MTPTFVFVGLSMMTEFKIEKNKHLGNMNIGKHYHIQFEFYIDEFGSFEPSGTNAYKNIFHNTASGGDGSKLGDRLPALFLYKDGRLYFTTTIGENPDYHFFSTEKVVPKQWNKVVMYQKEENEEVGHKQAF